MRRCWTGWGGRERRREGKREERQREREMEYMADQETGNTRR